jgi:hypothetical protein
MPTILGATPVNQLNALPLRTATAAAADGDIEVVGGTISRYWSPAVLGINGVGSTLLGGNFFLATGYLNTTGVSRYVLILNRQNAVGDAVALSAFTVHAQYRISKLSTPGINPITDQVTNGYLNLISTGVAFVGVAAPLDQTAIVSWASETSLGSSANARPLLIGSDCRIVINQTGANPPDANDFFTMALWGQT